MIGCQNLYYSLNRSESYSNYIVSLCVYRYSCGCSLILRTISFNYIFMFIVPGVNGPLDNENILAFCFSPTELDVDSK